MGDLSLYAIVCPLVFLAGFIDSIAGGGGFISLPAYILTGIPVHMAIGTNKLSAGMGTALATYRFAKNGYIKWKTASYSIVAALLGAAIGARITLLIDDRVFKTIMLIVLPVTGLYVVFNKRMGKPSDNVKISNKKQVAIILCVSFIIGIYDGFYGPGTGTFLILLLTGWAHLSLNDSAGITKVINLTTNVTSLVVFIMSGKVIFALGLVAGCFSIAGNYLGTKLFSKKGVKIVKPIIMVVLVIFFIKLLTELL